MTQAEPIPLMGAPGSPYTRKMLGVLRYRRIPYRFMLPPEAARAGMPQPKVSLLPTFYFPADGGGLEAVVDSTPVIRRLEREHAGRSLIPSDPALAFLNDLVEDYADEWLTKPMFHYRWAHQVDAEKAARQLPLWRGYSIPDGVHAERARAVGERQIARLYVVGSNPVTAPVIEASYQRFLAAFEAHLSRHAFVLGERPSSCDFAIFGQLTQLALFDPTPSALTVARAPRVYAWVGIMEDLSGFEPPEEGCFDIGALPETLTALLAEIGRVYVPVMLANARALATGANEVDAVVDDKPWRQPPFPYQGKCLKWLRDAYAALPAKSRGAVDPILEASGCAPAVALVA